MKFVFRISGDINCWDSVEDCDTGGPSSITVRMEYLRAFQYWYCKLCVKNRWGRKQCFVHSCSLTVLDSSVAKEWSSWSEAVKLQALRPVTLLKKRPQHGCLPVKLAKFLRTSFLKNTSGGCFCTYCTHMT